MSTQDPIFIQVGDLADGFAPDSNILMNTAALIGQQFTLHFADGTSQHIQIENSQTLSWQASQTTAPVSTPYRATTLRDGIYFLDFISPIQAASTITLVINQHQQSAVMVVGQLPTEAETRIDMFSRVEKNLPLTPVTTQISFATLNRPFSNDDQLPTFTQELIGQRVMYTYSKTERYEHVYLNDHFYAWQCLDGVEKGLADVDRCHYIKVSDLLYLFVWQEKIVPTLGVVMVDLQRLKTDGKIVGYRGNDFGELSNFPVGAIAQPLNKTIHPAIAS